MTELVSGVDIVQEQFGLAAGRPLSAAALAAAARAADPGPPRDRGPVDRRGPGAVLRADAWAWTAWSCRRAGGPGRHRPSSRATGSRRSTTTSWPRSWSVAGDRAGGHRRLAPGARRDRDRRAPDDPAVPPIRASATPGSGPASCPPTGWPRPGTAAGRAGRRRGPGGRAPRPRRPGAVAAPSARPPSGPAAAAVPRCAGRRARDARRATADPDGPADRPAGVAGRRPRRGASTGGRDERRSGSRTGRRAATVAEAADRPPASAPMRRSARGSRRAWRSSSTAGASNSWSRTPAGRSARPRDPDRRCDRARRPDRGSCHHPRAGRCPWPSSPARWCRPGSGSSRGGDEDGERGPRSARRDRRAGRRRPPGATVELGDVLGGHHGDSSRPSGRRRPGSRVATAGARRSARRRCTARARAARALRDLLRDRDPGPVHGGGHGRPRRGARPGSPGRVPLHPGRPADDVPEPVLDDAPVRGLRDRRGDQPALPLPPRAGPDRASRWPSTCRPRWATTPTPPRRKGRSGGSASRSRAWRTWPILARRAAARARSAPR